MSDVEQQDIFKGNDSGMSDPDSAEPGGVRPEAAKCDLSAKASAQRSGAPASGRAAMEALLRGLNEREIIYHAKITRLIRVSEVEIDAHGFSAKAEALARVPAWALDSVPLRCWSFASSWDYLEFHGRAVTAAYGGWTIYTDPELVCRTTIKTDR